MWRSRNYTQKTATHGQIVNVVSIRKGAVCFVDLSVPNHWECDLVFGSGNSKIAMLVGRQMRYAKLIRFGDKDLQAVVYALTKYYQKLRQARHKSRTEDRGEEMVAY
jgi:IS30 family transposase